MAGLQVTALARAAAMAAEWRGLYVADPDPNTMAAFDSNMREIRMALRKVRQIQREQKEAKK
jgi:hypothetical protein